MAKRLRRCLGWLCLAAAVALLADVALAQPASASAVPARPASTGDSARFDGRWAVQLVCADVTTASGSAKGYTYQFVVEIRQGQLKGHHALPGAADTLDYRGTVQPDGRASIQANGTTGNAAYSVGQVPPGRPYAYHLSGQFSGNSGRATRSELRPCEASFTRL